MQLHKFIWRVFLANYLYTNLPVSCYRRRTRARELSKGKKNPQGLISGRHRMPHVVSSSVGREECSLSYVPKVESWGPGRPECLTCIWHYLRTSASTHITDPLCLSFLPVTSMSCFTAMKQCKNDNGRAHSEWESTIHFSPLPVHFCSCPR